ncbi:hypothetical protein D3C77_371370 [compost metagenome]
MKKSDRSLLQSIYDSNTLQAIKVIEKVERVYKDHRDFYPLVSLINSGHIGYAGEDYDPKKPYADTHLTYIFQCYAQGLGQQRYKKTTPTLGVESEDVYFYIGPKGVEYFEKQRSESNRIWISGLLSLGAALTVVLVKLILDHFFPSSK